MPHDYQLIILGGGISGLGVAVAAAEHRIPTVVLEAHTLASATSNNTLRIIHGGFRYLQKLQLARVVRSLNDQTRVATNFPDAVAPLPCLMPLKAFGLKSQLPVGAAALTYGAAMKLLRSPLPTPHTLSSAALQTIAPQLGTLATHGALCWHDLVMTDPARVAARITDDVAAKGVTIRSHTTATAITRTTAGYTVTTSSGEQFSARTVVNTLGPWIDTLETPSRPPRDRTLWCLGFNITISRQIHPTHAIAVESPEGRLFFAVPRGSGTAIGTWYTPCAAPSRAELGAAPTIPPAELSKFVAAWNAAWPTQAIAASDIVATDVGILPMRRDTPTGPALYGAERIRTVDKYCEVLSTKYTTFYSQGRAAVRAVIT